ncbi:MAG: glycosyltransferase family 4 protein [Tepidiformaceae bacterium]
MTTVAPDSAAIPGASETPFSVLITLTFYYPHRTGLSLHVQYVAEELARRGHKVTVLTAQFRDDLPLDEMMNGVHIVRLKTAAQISRGVIMPSFPTETNRLVKEHDVVSIHTPMLETPLVARLARHHHKGVVITHHGDLTLPSGLMNRAIQATMSQLYHFGARAADRIIAYSDDYAEHSPYISPYLSKATANYPPVKIIAPSPDARQKVRAQLGIDDKTPLVGYSGRFVEEKRPDLLLRALPHLDRILPGAHLAFAGQYLMPYEDFYERSLPLIKRVEDRAHFLGLIQNEQDLADFYAACDVLVLPSSSECFGLVQVESMLCGTPVISTDIAGAREPVRVSGMGEVVRQRDTLALAQAIARVITNRPAYVRTREEISAIFNFERTVDGYETILRDAAERAANR